MINYTIKNGKNSKTYHRQFENVTEARHWIINHLDLSLNWNILRIQ